MKKHRGAGSRIDLVGGDVEEAEGVALGSAQALIELPGGVEQGLGADDVGAHEGARVGDRAVDVALGGEVHHRLGAHLLEGGADGVAVADVGLDQAVAALSARG